MSSYADREGFGRREQEIDPARLRDQAVYQLGALTAIAEAAGSRVAYVKPHGALYNRCSVDPIQASAVIEAIVAVDGALMVLCQPGAALAAAAAAQGLTPVPEGFADRAYRIDGTLLSRWPPGSVLSVDAALRQASMIARQERVSTVEGETIGLSVRSLCIHSDTPGAGALAHALRETLTAAGVAVRPFS